MYDVYVRIFKRCGFDVKIVEVDMGVMGGVSLYEFMVLLFVGEVEIVYCKLCGYVVNLEKVECLDILVENNEEFKEK